MSKEEIMELAEEHWEYTAGLLDALDFDEDKEVTLGLRYIYIQAFIHGFKHGEEN